MKRIFVTGASGFVGANLVRRLLGDGHEVHVLLRNEKSWRLEEVSSDLHAHIGDLRDSGELLRIVGRVRPEWVFHLATYGAYSWQTDLSVMVDTNIIGTANVVNACLTNGFEVLINTGSSSEYGFKDHAPPENELPEPNSSYAVTKASTTLFCRSAAHAHNAQILTLRLYSVYGPYEEPRRLIPSVITLGLKGELPKLVSAEIARDYIYVDDVIEAFIAAAATQQTAEGGAVYNVGTGRQTSLREVVEIARHIMKIPVVPTWGSMPNRQWDTDLWLADNAKITRELRWQPRVGFEEGLRKTIAWFCEHPALFEFYKQQLA